MCCSAVVHGYWLELRRCPGELDSSVYVVVGEEEYTKGSTLRNVTHLVVLYRPQACNGTQRTSSPHKNKAMVTPLHRAVKYSITSL